MLRYVLPVLLIASLSPPAFAQEARQGQIAGRLSTQMFVREANAGNRFEIQSSQLALSRSGDPQVRSFARRIIADHRLAGRQLQSALRRAGWTPPPARLDAQHLRMLGQVRNVRGPQFDRRYMEAQIMAHENAIGLHRAYATSGRVLPIRRFAQQVLPTLEQHLDMALRLERRVAPRTAGR